MIQNLTFGVPFFESIFYIRPHVPVDESEFFLISDFLTESLKAKKN